MVRELRPNLSRETARVVTFAQSLKPYERPLQTVDRVIDKNMNRDHRKSR